MGLAKVPLKRKFVFAKDVGLHAAKVLAAMDHWISARPSDAALVGNATAAGTAERSRVLQIPWVPCRRPWLARMPATAAPPLPLASPVTEMVPRGDQVSTALGAKSRAFGGGRACSGGGPPGPMAPGKGREISNYPFTIVGFPLMPGRDCSGKNEALRGTTVMHYPDRPSE